uniref:Uncharacterized protein n=1 Tax=Arundo donax TaxID=35708 RepID=A0A0A8ZCJ4_ARUDO
MFSVSIFWVSFERRLFSSPMNRGLQVMSPLTWIHTADYERKSDCLGKCQL